MEAGMKFGRWTLLGPWKKSESQTSHLCKCDCGTERYVRKFQLKSGKSLSCGCYAIEQAAKANTTHGMSNSPEFRSWDAMKDRCFNSGRRDASSYIGRGITVCDRWLGKSGFENFYHDMGPRPKGYSLDRIDVNGNYTPENCRWATNEQQQRNKTNNHHVIYKGKDYVLADLAQKLGIRQDTALWRLKKWGSVTKEGL